MALKRTKKLKDKIPFHKAFAYVALSCIILWGLVFAVWKFKQYQRFKKQQDHTYDVVAIVQTSPESNILRTQVLAEILGLSKDKPENLYALSFPDLTKKLSSCPVIKWAKVSPIKPCIVHIEYEVKEPFAEVIDFLNIAIDKDGSLFPIYPFLTPKNLPKIYLGLSPFGLEERVISWDTPVTTNEFQLAREVIEFIRASKEGNEIQVKMIDTHKAFHTLQGQREIVVELEEHWKDIHYVRKPVLLRLATSNWEERLGQYLQLYKTLYKAKPFTSNTQENGFVVDLPKQIVDLRIPKLILLKDEENELCIKKAETQQSIGEKAKNRLKAK